MATTEKDASESTVKATTEATAATTTTRDNQYFFEDQVFLIDKAGRAKFGLIIETCETYSGDEDDEDDDEKLGHGDVRVAWYPHGREHVRSEKTIGLADRTLMPGDVVRRMTAGNPQRGYVRDIKITADVKIIGLPYVIKNVAAERLRPLSIWQRDCTVCLDSWVGSAKDVDERAVLKGVNGVRFEIHSSDFYHFKEAGTSGRPLVFTPLIFFPGNIVVGRLPSTEKAIILTPDIPLPLNRKGSMLKGKFVVESVRTEGVIVQWQCKALSKGSSKKISELEPPQPYVSAEQLNNVKRLNVFESCVLQIADRSYLTYEPKDMLISKSKWDKEIATRFKEIFQQQQKIFGMRKSKKTKLSKSTTENSKLSASENSNVDNLRSKRIKCDKSDVDKDDDTDDEWVETSTTASSDTSELSTEVDESEEENIAEDRSDMDSVSKPEPEPPEIVTKVENVHGSAGASLTNTKKPLVTRNIVKRSIASRNKHSKLQGNSSKWQYKNSVNAPFANMYNVPEGKELITETLLVYSTVSVVWQDGTVEHDIPSTELYPIHHLDNHEFFPGDFTMLSREDPNITFRDYGVIQTVDHQGRTAKVKWFKTYTSEDEPNFSPTFNGESEVSVYDLKDHPDFTYRPGGMVIRVSNFTGDDAICTAGQVLDNCIDGRVKIAWVDGHTSCCYPQDLFDVGHHEQNDYVGDSDSWETQSEHSVLGADDEVEGLDNADMAFAESDVIVNIDRARSAIARLEDILKSDTQLQTRNVMRKLLSIYKTGSHIDRLMQTSFFHQNNFFALIDGIAEEEEPELNATETPIVNQEIKVLKDRWKQTLQSIIKNYEEGGGNMVNDEKIESSSPDNQQNKELKLEEEEQTKTIEKSMSMPTSTPAPVAEECHVTATTALSSSNNSPKVLLNVGVRIASGTNNVTGIGSGSGSKGSNNSTTQTPVRHLRNCTYTTHVLHVRNDANLSQICGPDAPKSLYSVLPASELEKLVEEEKQQQQQQQQNTNKDGGGGGTGGAMSQNQALSSGNNQFDIHNAEKNHLLSSALLSIEKAYQVTNHIKTNVEAILSQILNSTTILCNSPPPHDIQDDSGTFSRNNSDSSNNAAIESDIAVGETTTTTIDVDDSTPTKNDSKIFDVTSNMMFTEQLHPCLICVPLCTMLKEQLQKCLNEIERQSTRFTTYKSFVVPVNINVTAAAGEDNKNDSLCSETTNAADAQNQNGLDITITNTNSSSNSNESPTQVCKLKKMGTQNDLSNIIIATADTYIVPDECFKILPNAPKNHKFYTSTCEPSQPQYYFRAVQREHRLLKTSLPKGIWLRFYEDRIDLLSVMMEGPKKTPYENGLYFFDIQLDQDYPKRPPVCHYISYCIDRLNPNLYEEGKVCVSLLGTWSGRDVEVWGPNSTLLQVLVSIQGLILVPEPYFNEAGYEKQKGSQQGLENSRMYNEMVVIKVTQSTLKMLSNPPKIFCKEILEYYKQYGVQMYERIRGWMELSKSQIQAANNSTDTSCIEAIEYVKPDFPLLPASRGFCLTLDGLLKNFKEKIENFISTQEDNCNCNTESAEKNLQNCKIPLKDSEAEECKEDAANQS